MIGTFSLFIAFLLVLPPPLINGGTLNQPTPPLEGLGGLGRLPGDLRGTGRQLPNAAKAVLATLSGTGTVNENVTCQGSSCGSSDEIEEQLSRIEETLDDWEVAKLSVILDVAGNDCSANCTKDSDNDEQCQACVKERMDPVVFAQLGSCVGCLAKLLSPAKKCYNTHGKTMATVKCILKAANSIKSCKKCAAKKICGLMSKINKKLGKLCCQASGHCSSREILKAGDINTLTFFNDLNTEPGLSMTCDMILDQNTCSTTFIPLQNIGNLRVAQYTDPKPDCRVVGIACRANGGGQVPCSLVPSSNATFFTVSTAGINGDSCSIEEA